MPELMVKNQDAIAILKRFYDAPQDIIEKLKARKNDNKVRIWEQSSPFEKGYSLVIATYAWTSNINIPRESFHYIENFYKSQFKLVLSIGALEKFPKSDHLDYLKKYIINNKDYSFFYIGVTPNGEERILYFIPQDVRYKGGYQCSSADLNMTLEDYNSLIIQQATTYNPIDIDIEDNYNDKGEEKPMTTLNSFGPSTATNIRLCPFGFAVSEDNSHYFTYDTKKTQTVDVTDISFNLPNMIYKIPVATKDLRAGDLILHKDKPMFILDPSTEEGIAAVDIFASEAKIILPVSNAFGFSFVTKFISLFNMNSESPSEDQPFGNIGPMLLAQSFLSDNSQMDLGKLFMVQAMTGNSQNLFGNLFSTNNN